MPWIYNGRTIREGRSWTNDSGITHPSNWGQWSNETKAAEGLVFQEPPPPYDSTFYWDANTPKDLDDAPVLDDQGQPVVVDGVEQVTVGLKTSTVERLQTSLEDELRKTDRQVLDALEAGTPIPESVKALRKAARDRALAGAEQAQQAADVDGIRDVWTFPVGTDDWRETGDYAVGDVVLFKGIPYTCLQDHTAQASWTPPSVPALWSIQGQPSGSEWVAGELVNVGDQRTYQGTLYTVLQGHTTQAGWEPPNVPSLWTAA